MVDYDYEYRNFFLYTHFGSRSSRQPGRGYGFSPYLAGSTPATTDRLPGLALCGSPAAVCATPIFPLYQIQPACPNKLPSASSAEFQRLIEGNGLFIKEITS
jgi:hypothetical protein|tara:strand:+ start:110168 stop:110473 length:306 start_codon:yes stop_codon:yes gene_type:complete